MKFKRHILNMKVNMKIKTQTNIKVSIENKRKYTKIIFSPEATAS